MDEDVDEDIGPIEEVDPGTEGWITLAHVCRRWRSVIFQSPHRLNLRLFCTPKTPTRDSLDIWLPLPLIIRHIPLDNDEPPSIMDNTIAALERNDRVCQILLDFSSSSQFEYVEDSAAMHKPFPELTDLWLSMFVNDGPGQYFQIRSWAEPHHVCDHFT